MSFLKEKEIDASRLGDPWGRPYHVRRSYQWQNEIFEFASEGPDKTLRTSDDFTAMTLSRPFFEFDAKRLRGIIDTYHARTGGYIRDESTLEAACAQLHNSVSSFVDPWGTPYRFLFEIERENYTIKVLSAGPDKHFRSGPNDPTGDWDDLQVSVERMPYFRETAQRISDALFDSAKSSAHFPENEQEFQKAMASHGIDWQAMRDPWGRPYRIVTGVEVAYSDKVTLRAYGQNVTASQTPVTRKSKAISIVSDGPDLTPNTPDDFVLAKFASPFLEEMGNATNKLGTPQKQQPIYSGNSGAVRVVVQDPMGAVIPNAKITLTNEATDLAYEDNQTIKVFAFSPTSPPAAIASWRKALAFRSYVLTNIPILSSNVTEVAVTLNVGAAQRQWKFRRRASNFRPQVLLSRFSLLASR